VELKISTVLPFNPLKRILSAGVKSSNHFMDRRGGNNLRELYMVSSMRRLAGKEGIHVNIFTFTRDQKNTKNLLLEPLKKINKNTIPKQMTINNDKTRYRWFFKNKSTL